MKNINNSVQETNHDDSNDSRSTLISKTTSEKSSVTLNTSQESFVRNTDPIIKLPNSPNQQNVDPASTSLNQNSFPNLSNTDLNIFLKPITINVNATRKEKALFTMFLKHFESTLRFTDHDFNLKLAAREIGTNEKYISSAINNCTGMSFNKIVNHYRIEYAKKLIHDDILTHHNLEEIAYMAGYGNRTTFYRVFTELVGITPSRFRDNLNRGISM